MRTRLPLFLAVFVPFTCLFSILAYQLPPIHDRLAWRVSALVTQIRYTLNPPEEVIFVPQEQAQISGIVEATMNALSPTLLPPTSTAAPSPTATQPGPTPTSPPSPTPTITPTPLPASMRLSGIKHEYQKWNNCGPATLSMALSYWDWQGDQLDAAEFMKPNPRDKNVMPYEMEAFIKEKANLQAVVRQGGDLELIKRFVVAGFPVVIEKGFEGDRFDGWMGHYEVVTGYDEAQQMFWVFDSYVGPDKDFLISYEEVAFHWRAFNYVYVIPYPAEREGEVMALLGPHADEIYNLQAAAARASEETYTTTGRDQFFAWYNYGTNLVRLQDYSGAAAAYDQAFTLYPSIPEEQRPWRMLWYQTGPYFAYFYTGRYYDVIDLASKTITTSSEPAIEESFYWRGKAKLALGDTPGAIEDFQTTLKWHPGFAVSLAELKSLGVEPEIP